ncbi:ECF transporter S component, partial [Dysosmobacter welbionis]
AVVLPLLPAGDVALHPHDALLHIPDGLSGRNGQDVNGEHQVAGEVRQFGDQGVLDVAGIVPQEQNSSEPAAHLEVVCPKTHSIRTDIVPEVVSQAHGAPQIKAVILFLSRAEKAVEDAQALMGIQDPRPAVQLTQIFRQIRVHPMEKGPGFLQVFPGCADCDVLILYQVIAASGLIHKDAIVLP